MYMCLLFRNSYTSDAGILRDSGCGLATCLCFSVNWVYKLILHLCQYPDPWANGD